MQLPKASFDDGSSESQHGGGAVSQDGPKTRAWHWTWHSTTASVHLSVARITFSANFAPAAANCFWQCETTCTSGMLNAAAGTAAASRIARTRDTAPIDMLGPLPRSVTTP